ncbi:LuxR family transcriptional regulator [Roseobacter sp. HKCCA0434]|uniref:LuxR family transcriptional regulator n=1 Tax=Roseobacter sp. HKCCA0434 TaxID=3079297 RepID=UPI0029058F17|nr:LuxR family transcriptional regulator [Roseobacter sp. HKCCA0434]
MTSPQVVDIDKYIQHMADCETAEEVWNCCVEFFHSHDFETVSYHVMPLAWETSDSALQIRSDGLPAEWVENYHDRKLWQIDPIPAAALNRSLPFLWSDLENLRQLTASEQEFIDEMEEKVEGDGIAIQVFGPYGRNGYFGLGYVRDVAPLSRADLRMLQWACQLTHHRYCEVEDFERAPLSKREQEVLSWVARGKSNSSIADILEISSYTVDAYMRRIYQKLGVNDRVSAAIRGLGSGLIKSAA